MVDIGTDPLVGPAADTFVELALTVFVSVGFEEFDPTVVTDGESDNKIEDFVVSASSCLFGNESPAKIRELLSIGVLF